MTLQQAINCGYRTVRKPKWAEGTYLTLEDIAYRSGHPRPELTYFFLHQARQPNARDLPFRADRFRYDKDEWEGVSFK